MMQKFENPVTDAAALRKILGKPQSAVVNKSIDHLDKHCRTFIGRSPFVLVASSDESGNLDISPKGDPAGFTTILDDKTLVIPDRPGNRRADTYFNIIQNPKVGLIFLIPGKKETLRVSGSAQIIRDPDILQVMAVNRKVPVLGLAVHVQEAFFHCSKCMVRSGLWSPGEWPSLDGLPSLAEAVVDAAMLKVPTKIVDIVIKRDEKKRLY
jgi:PPOX class probable FMN-dependent enzyme